MALLVVGTAEAQSVPPPSPSPSSGLPAFVGLPWGIGIANPSGVFLRKFWVPPRTVVLDTYLPVPETLKSEALQAVDTPTAPRGDASPGAETSPQVMVWRQTAVVPGFWVNETTVGFQYPQRWELEQTAPGTYAWRLLPPVMLPR
jgi:hypothetical protein